MSKRKIDIKEIAFWMALIIFIFLSGFSLFGWSWGGLLRGLFPEDILVILLFVVSVFIMSLISVDIYKAYYSEKNKFFILFNTAFVVMCAVSLIFLMINKNYKN